MSMMKLFLLVLLVCGLSLNSHASDIEELDVLLLNADEQTTIALNNKVGQIIDSPSFSLSREADFFLIGWARYDNLFILPRTTLLRGRASTLCRKIDYNYRDTSVEINRILGKLRETQKPVYLHVHQYQMTIPLWVEKVGLDFDGYVLSAFHPTKSIFWRAEKDFRSCLNTIRNDRYEVLFIKRESSCQNTPFILISSNLLKH